jgi:hypothetical protein
MTHAKTLLSRKSQSFNDVVKVLDDFRDSIDEVGDDGEEPIQRIILNNLVAYMRGLE